MTSNTKGEMKWADNYNKTALTLWVKPSGGATFQIYSSYAGSVPDYKIPKGTKGWATYQHLLKAGWSLVK